MVSIDVPTQPNTFPMYHTLQIKPHTENDAENIPLKPWLNLAPSW